VAQQSQDTNTHALRLRELAKELRQMIGRFKI